MLDKTPIMGFLNQTVFTFNGTPISVLYLILAPVMLISIFLLLNWASRLIILRLEKKQVDPNLIQLIRRVFFILIIAVLFFTSLELLNIPLTAFAFISGAIAIGFGFGAQNIINNFISGWILMWEKPIKIGDFLEIGDAKGIVESIDTRSTRIRRVDGVHLLIPNSYLLENMVVNWTLVNNLTRTSVRVGVAYGSDVRQVSELIAQSVEEHSDILQHPKPTVIFEDFADSALVFDTFFWVDTIGEKNLREIRSDIRFRLKELFSEQGVVISFPQQDIHVDGAIEILSSRDFSNKAQGEK